MIMKLPNATCVGTQTSKVPTRVTLPSINCSVPQSKRIRQLVDVRCNRLIEQQRNNKENKGKNLPNFCLINARSLNHKIDELAAFMAINKIEIAAITKTWFHDNIDDEQVSIDGYIIHRKDRSYSTGRAVARTLIGRGGGIFIYSGSAH